MPVAYKLVDSGTSKVACEATVSKYDLVYINKDNGLAGKIDGSTINKMPVRGIVVKKVGNFAYITQNIKIVYDRIVFEAGDNLFASTSTLGNMQVGKPFAGFIAQMVGKALSDTEILITINPNDAVIL